MPGYHEAIRRPRCLEQIQRSLAKGKYAAPALFLADVQLVWDNCREVGGLGCLALCPCRVGAVAGWQGWLAGDGCLAVAGSLPSVAGVC